MSYDASIEEKVLQKHGASRETFEKGKRARNLREFNTTRLIQVGSMILGEAMNLDEQEIEDIEKEIEQEEEKAKKAQEEKIEGWLRVLNQEQGQDFFLKVMVDTGATINAITYGMLLDHQLDSRVSKLEEPLELDLAVGSFQCDEAISIPWVGKGNQRHDAATFYVLPRGQAKITDRVILSREWLGQMDLLCDEDERDSLKPLFGGRESASEKAARERACQQAENDRASSAKAKGAHQNTGGQTGLESPSKGSSRPAEAGK